MNGSALALNWENKNLDAIVEAWYPGQEGGTAIADVLFGDYNPSGRLPVTFYKSVNQLPPFEDYAMKGRTYRYFEGEPLYPFGYGLSYTTFKYGNLQVPFVMKAGDTSTINVEVENSGKFDGDEVVQLYVKHLNASFHVPLIALAGFKRIRLKAGEKKMVSFILDPRKLSVINNEYHRVVLPGEVEIFVGGSQPSKIFLGSNQILKSSIKIKGNIYSVE
jgi:beta-glucosidase